MHEIEFRSSRLLRMLLSGMLALTLAAVYLAALSGTVKLALGMFAIGLVAWGAGRASPRTSLRIAADGGLQCLDDTAEWRDAEVLGDSFVAARLIVLRYRVADQNVQTLTLLPDSAEADDLRRLRVSLRWARRTRSDTAFPGAG
jgi:toxin CptA